MVRKLSPRERDLNRKMAKETEFDMSMSKRSFSFIKHLATANPGIIFECGGGSIYIAPEDERTDDDSITMVKLTKKEWQSNGMIDKRVYILNVRTVSDTSYINETKNGLTIGQEMKERFMKHVPNSDERKQVDYHPQMDMEFLVDHHGITPPEKSFSEVMHKENERRQKQHQKENTDHPHKRSGNEFSKT